MGKNQSKVKVAKTVQQTVSKNVPQKKSNLGITPVGPNGQANFTYSGCYQNGSDTWFGQASNGQAYTAFLNLPFILV